MGETIDETQLHRAVANVLWPYLRTYEDGQDGWEPYRETRAIHPTGAPRSHTYSSASPFPVPDSLSNTELLGVRYGIITTLHSTDWPGRKAFRVYLWRDEHDKRLARLPAAAIADYEAALEHSTARKPFQLETDPEGVRRLTRNRNDGTITHLTASALENIAATTTLKPLPPEIEARINEAKLGGEDISLDAIRAALQLAGSTEEP